MVCAILFSLLASLQGSSSRATPDQLFREAIAAQQGGNFTTAIRDYQELLQLRPDLVEARVNLGAALAQTGRFDAAITQYLKALPSAPEKDSIRTNLGLAYFKKGDLENAAQQFQTVHQAQPDDVRIAILLGDTDIRLQRPDAALSTLQPLASVNLQNPDFQFVYGSALIKTGKLQDGMGLVEKSAVSENSPDEYMLAGTTALQLNAFEEARQDLNAAARLGPAIPGVWTFDGIANDRTGNATEAEAAFRRALKVKPDDFDANLYLGVMLYKRRAMDESKQYLIQALEIDPKSPMARYENAMWESTSGQYPAAVAILEKLVAEDPKWLEPHVELATLYYKLHRNEDGAKERQIVEQITAQQQREGPR